MMQLRTYTSLYGNQVSRPSLSFLILLTALHLLASPSLLIPLQTSTFKFIHFLRSDLLASTSYDVEIHLWSSIQVVSPFSLPTHYPSITSSDSKLLEVIVTLILSSSTIQATRAS